MDKIQREKIKEIPLSRIEKYLDILIHNLRVSLRRANWERKRQGFEMTADVINEVETKPILLNVFHVIDILDVKLEMEKNK